MDIFKTSHLQCNICMHGYTCERSYMYKYIHTYCERSYTHKLWTNTHSVIPFFECRLPQRHQFCTADTCSAKSRPTLTSPKSWRNKPMSWALCESQVEHTTYMRKVQLGFEQCCRPLDYCCSLRQVLTWGEGILYTRAILESIGSYMLSLF